MATVNGLPALNGRLGINLLDAFGRPVNLQSDPLRQASHSGTPNHAGLSQPDDYQVVMADPLQRMQTFEEMRASDDAVEAAHSARVQMISSGNWQLSAQGTAGARNEVLEFCEDNIYPILDDLLRWLASGALQYGFGMVEPVYAWSEELPRRGYVRQGKSTSVRKFGRRIVLSKLQHVRQRTVYTFLLDRYGNLQAVRQYVWTGAEFLNVDIDPVKLLVWTYDRQGDDYWGVPPLRHIYKAYTFKNQLERLNILGVDRFGVGMPVAEAGPGWAQKDYDKLEEYLRAWRSGNETYLIHPAGGKIEIKAAEGTLFASVLEFIQFYNHAIARAHFTQSSELGTTETGARAVGDVLLEQTQTIVQADMEALANLINEKLVVPLVRLNFGEQDDYPRFTPSQRVAASAAFSSAVTSLIGSKAVTWRVQDEVYLRDVMHLPEVTEAELTREREERAAAALEAARAAQPPAPGQPPQPGGAAARSVPDADPKAVPEGRQTEAAKRERQERSRAARKEAGANRALMQVDEGEHGYDKWNMPASLQADMGGTYRTVEWSEWEQGIVKPNVLARDLDLQAARLAAEVLAALAAIDVALAAQVARMAEGGVDALQEGIRKIAVPEREKAKLRRIVSDAADRARSYGSSSVTNEIARQDGAAAALVAPAEVGRTDTATFDLEADAVRRNAALRAEIDRAVEAETNRREEAVRAGALLAIYGASSAAAIAALAASAAAKVQSALEDLSTNRTIDNVGSVVNAGFGTGRRDGFDTVVTEDPDRIVGKVYSAVMDGGTCDECAKWDGGRFPVDYPEDATGVQAPNPRCEGSTKRCRCIWVYITREEVPSTVPSSRGPV